MISDVSTGIVSIKKGFVTEKQLSDALSEQISNDPPARLRPHKRIGEILFGKDWMTLKQIETALAEIYKDKQ